MPVAKTFRSLSEEVAARFLHTVVVFDDQAFLPRPSVASKSKTSKKLVPPSRYGAITAQEKNLGPSPMGTEHDLDAKRLIDAFAEIGLVCAILVPTKNENLLPQIVTAARRSDIVMLDWRIHGDNGQTTTTLIREILKDDGSDESRLRMIVIYTAEPDLHSIVAKVKAELANHLQGHPLIEAEAFTLIKGPVRIVVFAKKDTLIGAASPELRKRITPLDKLPKRMVTEYSSATMGLMSNVALESLAGLRSNTHKILAKFQPELDSAYLTHRALISPPEEAELHLVPLVLSEMQAILEDREVFRHASLENIGKWLDYRVGDGLKLYRRLKMRAKNTARTALLDIAEKGIGDKGLSVSYPQIKRLLDGLRLEKNKTALNEFTKLLVPEGISALEYDRQMALLMSVRSRYESPIPKLMLGTIIAEEGADGLPRYWLCVQPLCDCVRLRTKRNFPFLKMSRSAAGASFNYIVNDGDSWVELNLSLRPYESRLLTFKPKTGEGEIQASKKDDSWYFQSSDSGKKDYRWISDLKTEHAQRVANDYSTQISRVGLMESEWLRRWAKK